MARVGVGSRAAEGAVGHRVGQVKLQLPVAEAIHLLEDKRAKHLLARHAGTASRRRASAEVLRDAAAEHRILIKKVGDDLELFGIGHVEPGLDECRLGSESFAHSWLTLLA